MKNYKYYFDLIEKVASLELFEILDIQKIGNGGPLNKKQKRIFNEIENHDSLKGFYSFINGYEFKWTAKKIKGITGAVNCLKIEEAIVDGNNIVYFDHTPENSPLKDFCIIDFFTDEACVGIYRNQPDLPGLHYFDFENETEPLWVDFEGYFKLLELTKGFLYWQKVILAHNGSYQSETIQLFKDIMPQVFPDFNFDNFLQVYDEIKIKP